MDFPRGDAMIKNNTYWPHDSCRMQEGMQLPVIISEREQKTSEVFMLYMSHTIDSKPSSNEEVVGQQVWKYIMMEEY